MPLTIGLKLNLKMGPFVTNRFYPPFTFLKIERAPGDANPYYVNAKYNVYLMRNDLENIKQI